MQSVQFDKGTAEYIAYLVTIAGGVAGFSFWAVMSIVTSVIRKELGPLVAKVNSMDTRLSIVETILGLNTKKESD